MAGCTSQTPVTPTQPSEPVLRPPLGGIVVEPEKTPEPTFMPTPAPTLAPTPEPACSAPCEVEQSSVLTSHVIAYTTKFDYYPNFCCGATNQLYYYDDYAKDNFVLPGAGPNVFNPEAFAGGTAIAYERDGLLWRYDLASGNPCLFSNIPFFAARPSITEDGCFMTYVGFPGGCCPGYGHDGGLAYLWANGMSCELGTVNATAACQGGVNWIRISADGRWAVFTTACGGLYTYDVATEAVCLVADAAAIGPASMPDISPDGSLIAFTALAGRCGAPAIFLYNRVTDCIDPLPFANLAVNAEATFNPQFLGMNQLFYQAMVPGCNTPSLFAYNIALRLTRTLSILNML